MFGGHLYRLMRWRPESGEPPPSIALLSVLSLAAEDMHGGDGFVAHDYYNRLMPLLGVDNEDDKQRVVRAYRDCSQRLWGSLNDWLEGIDGERGLPTAFALGNKHVGLPISQAILRATDREHVREFFADFGFAPRSHTSPRDMGALLGEWIGRTPSPASSAMQTLWRQQGARERIIEGCCALLESWDGPSLSGSGGEAGAPSGARRAPIRLTALLRTFPVAALELNFTGPTGGDDDTLQLLDAADAPGEVPLAIEPMTDRRWRLTEPERLDPLSMLDGWLRLRDRSGLVLERRPRRVVPLTKDDLLRVFFEIERLPLGESSLILSQAHLADTITEALGIIARPGFHRSDGPFPGLPSGWTLFSDVQVLAPLPAVRPDGSGWGFELDLNVLQPLSSSQLVVDGGFRLPGHLRRWSSLAPPEIRFATDEATSVLIEVSQLRSVDRTIEPFDRAFEGSAAVLPLAELSLPDGEYQVVASRVVNGASEPIDQVRLRLRSADEVNPAPRQHPPLVRELSAPERAVLTATASGEQGWTMQGPVVNLMGAESSSPQLVPQTVVGVPAWWDERASHRQDATHAERVIVPAVVLDDCFRTGRHVMVLPTFYGAASSATFQGHCRQCGIVKRYPSHFRARGRTTSKRQRYVPPSFDAAAIESVAEQAVKPDVALDALSHDRAGNARAFEQLALQIEPSQLFADRFLRGLECLGHLEVQRDLRTLSPISWEIAPPALVQVRDGVFVLTGFRSRRLTSSFEAAAATIGLPTDRRSQVAAPDRVRVKECDLTAAELIARHVFEEVGSSLAIVPEAALTLALLLPPLTRVAEALPRSPMIGFRSANRWDERLARWMSVSDASAPGAYQLLSSTVAYCIRDATDVASATMRRGDARLVKHIASSLAGSPLLGYDAETETLYAPLGAELPGLYSRAAVLASGLLPNEDTQQRLVAYPSVPEDLAEHLASVMSA